MENYHILVIAVENYHDDKNISRVKYAKNDAEQFLQSMIDLGCRSENLEYLVNDRATKTTILQKIKQVSNNARKGDTIIFYYAGHGFYSNGKNLISSVDTSLNSLEITAIDIEQVLCDLEESESKKIIGFLDCCHSGIKFSTNKRSPIGHFSTDDLKNNYNNAEHLIIFASCKEDEKSFSDIERTHGVWSYFLIEALKGNVPEIYENQLLFSDRLQSYLLDNIVTQYFDYVIGIEQSQENPAEYKMARRLENFKNSNILENPVLNEIFNETFNTLTFYLEKIDVEQIIDLTEDINDSDNIDVEYKTSDTSSCKIFLSGLDGLIKIDENTISIIHEDEKSPAELALKSAYAYMQLTAKGFPQLLNNPVKQISS